MLLIGTAISLASGGLSAAAIEAFFANLSQAFILDDEARGILDNDYLLA